jgi:hypothetical protein
MRDSPLYGEGDDEVDIICMNVCMQASKIVLIRLSSFTQADLSSRSRKGAMEEQEFGLIGKKPTHYLLFN